MVCSKLGRYLINLRDTNQAIVRYLLSKYDRNARSSSFTTTEPNYFAAGLQAKIER